MNPYSTQPLPPVAVVAEEVTLALACQAAAAAAALRQTLLALEVRETLRQPVHRRATAAVVEPPQASMLVAEVAAQVLLVFQGRQAETAALAPLQRLPALPSHTLEAVVVEAKIG